MAASNTDQTRFSFYTPWNHQAPLWVVTILSLIYSMIFLLARLAAKYKSLGSDDALLGLAYLVSLAQWSAVFQALNLGAEKLESTLSLQHNQSAHRASASVR
ncbi:hypothetical protein LTR86_010776 [Recurvomyces mirabilis]|nr:hypothetical protein LTR86_010776 [Recurvomyces mirabilis]